MGRAIATRLVCDLRDELSSLSAPVAFGVGVDGRVVIAGRTREASRSDEPSGLPGPGSTPNEAHDWVVLSGGEGEDLRRIDVRGERANFSLAQPLGDGALLVSARCRWRTEGPEQNAVVVDAHGAVVRRFPLGDGISDVRTTPSGAIWASYFDEGIFGNYGWGGPGPEPIGSTGLVRFDDRGTPCDAYDAAEAGTDAICDAYALNVDTNGVVHIYFYKEFPIVRLHGRASSRWTCGITGARALAVDDGRRALLLGSYEDPSAARIVELKGDGSTGLVVERSVTTPEGTPIGAMRAVGLGADLYFFDGARILQLARW